MYNLRKKPWQKRVFTKNILSLSQYFAKSKSAAPRGNVTDYTIPTSFFVSEKGGREREKGAKREIER